MTAAEKPICVSWRCPRSVECLVHYCRHTWAEIVAAKASERTINLLSIGEGCTDHRPAVHVQAALPLLGVHNG